MSDLPEGIRDLLDYNPESGVFTWKCRVGGNGCVRPGTRAGSIRGNGGYRHIKINRRHYREHRVAYEFMHGLVPPGMEIDHINGITDDNRIANLRLATHQENIANGRHRKNNTSGKKGVGLHHDGRWRARIFVDGRSRHIGLFDSLETAHEAYMKAARHFFGDFARSA